jgi:hypothetical protein
VLRELISDNRRRPRAPFSFFFSFLMKEAFERVYEKHIALNVITPAANSRGNKAHLHHIGGIN